MSGGWDPFADPEIGFLFFRTANAGILEKTQAVTKTVHLEDLPAIQLGIKKIERRVMGHQDPKFFDLPLQLFHGKIPHRAVKDARPNLRVIAFKKERRAVRILEDRFIRVQLLDQQTDRLEDLLTKDSFLGRDHGNNPAETGC